MADEDVPYRTLKRSRLIPPPPDYPKSLSHQNPLYPSSYDKPPVLPKGMPEWLTVEDAIHGARTIQEVLSGAEWRQRWEDITGALFRRAVNDDDPGANKAAELLLSYRFGKPVALDVSVRQTQLTAEDVAQIAANLKDSGFVVDTSFLPEPRGE